MQKIIYFPSSIHGAIMVLSFLSPFTLPLTQSRLDSVNHLILKVVLFRFVLFLVKSICLFKNKPNRKSPKKIGNDQEKTDFPLRVNAP